MTAMQEFLNRYPNSSYKEKAVEVIYSVQAKLEEKGFANARQYYKMRYYKAAIVALNNFKDNFPDSKYLEEASYLVVAAQYQLAEQSIRARQKERYQDVVQNYQEFVDRYPNSEFLKDAEKMYADSLQKLTQFRNTNS
jgi:outer membrane protein assembly factor BamD